MIKKLPNLNTVFKKLACPQCKNLLKLNVEQDFDKSYIHLNNGMIICPHCRKSYEVVDGIIDLFLGERSVQVDENHVWSVEVFNDVYRRRGLYKTSWEHRNLTGGIPKAVTDYDYPKVKGRLLQWLEVLPHESHILDVGCGTGYFIFEMNERYSTQHFFFFGLDGSKSRIKLLNKRITQEETSNVLGLIANGIYLPFGDNSMDAVVCTEVLEHVPTPQKLISETKRVLKPGGYFFISTPSAFAMNFWEFIRKTTRFESFMKQADKKLQPYDNPLYTSALKKLLCQEGFDIIHFERNVLIPPQGVFRRYSEEKTRKILTCFQFIEDYFKPVLGFLALHSVVLCQKIQSTLQMTCPRKTGHVA